jgi:ribosome-associated protein
MEALRLADGRAIPEAELRWSFARASGPGGQSVNTSDSAVRLAWDIAASKVLDDQERDRLLRRLGPRLSGTSLIVTAREHRSQWANRKAAADRLLALAESGLSQGPPDRRPTRPGPAARAARVADKRQRGEVKRLRQRPVRGE